MIKRPLTLLSRGVLLAIAVSAAPVVHADFTNYVFADPFFGNTLGVDLKTAPGTFAPIVGVGPGGATLYASDFYITGFVPSTLAIASETFNANFHVDFRDSSGTLIPGAGLNLTSTDFTVNFAGRTAIGQLGTFDLTLQSATFGAGTPFVVSLAHTATANVTISTGAAGGFNIHYNTPFVIPGQYSVGGTTYPTGNLGDANGGGVTSGNAPEPAILALVVPGLLAMAGLRKRRRAMLVAAV